MKDVKKRAVSNRVREITQQTIHEQMPCVRRYPAPQTDPSPEQTPLVESGTPLRTDNRRVQASSSSGFACWRQSSIPDPGRSTVQASELFPASKSFSWQYAARPATSMCARKSTIDAVRRSATTSDGPADSRPCSLTVQHRPQHDVAHEFKSAVVRPSSLGLPRVERIADRGSTNGSRGAGRCPVPKLTYRQERHRCSPGTWLPMIEEFLPFLTFQAA